MQITGRPDERLAFTVMVLVMCGVTVAVPARAAQTSPGQAAAEECRVLLAMDVFNQAIARCGEAQRLDPQLPDPYLMLGVAYDQLWQQENRTSPTPDEARIREHRRKAAENYNRFLTLKSSDTEAGRKARVPALRGLLVLYVIAGSDGSGGGRDDATMVAHANELAREPTLYKRELMAMAAVYAHHGQLELSETSLTRDLRADPGDRETCAMLNTLYSSPDWKDGTRFEVRIGNLELCAAQTPKDPAGYFRLAAALFEKVHRDATVSDAQELAYVERGLVNVNRALALDTNMLEALVYKGLLLRLKAMGVGDPSVQQQLRAEATALQDRAWVLKGGVVGGVVGGIPAEAIRVGGGDIPEPRKLRDVRPVYPPIAQSARVQGVVILECTLDPEGKVVDAKILHSIPLLDQAALDAVRQWVFAPTLLKGVPVPVIMTVTVTFKLIPSGNGSQRTRRESRVPDAAVLAVDHRAVAAGEPGTRDKAPVGLWRHDRPRRRAEVRAHHRRHHAAHGGRSPDVSQPGDGLLRLCLA